MALSPQIPCSSSQAHPQGRSLLPIARWAAEQTFTPFKQNGNERSRLGLGLASCQLGVEAKIGTLAVGDVRSDRTFATAVSICRTEVR